jgi:DNA-binding response OmpR family regulator
VPEKKWAYDEVEALYRQFNPNAVDGGGKKVVVAEDSPPMRALMVSALEKKGFVVHSAENGLEALKLIRADMPDCAVLDIGLPQVSGLDILEAMKKDPHFASIPVLIVTARKEKRDIMLAQKLGAAGYIVKPFRMEEVLKRVEELCGKGGGERRER